MVGRYCRWEQRAGWIWLGLRSTATVLVNKLVPCAWLLSDAVRDLEITILLSFETQACFVTDYRKHLSLLRREMSGIDEMGVRSEVDCLRNYDVSCQLNQSKYSSDQLSVLQPLWNVALNNKHCTQSPLFPIVVGVGSFFLFTLPFTFIDFYGKNWSWVKKYRIHPESTLTWPMVRDAVGLTLWNQLFYILPVSIAQFVWTSDTELPFLAPSLFEFLWQQFGCLAIYDLFIFTWHIIHHRSRFLYRHVHYVHHRPSVVNCWVSQYVHPYELFCVGIFGTTPPWILRSHPMTAWCFMIFNSFLGVETHSGYDFPIMLHRWFPFFGGTVKHEMHHQRPMVNFQPYFNWFDRLLGTECPGQQAGAFKSKALLDYERKEK